jgi:uncharacterized membrane protein
MSRLRNSLALLREQLWIIPLLLGASALALAYWLLSTEAALLERWDASRLWWLYGGDADTARGLLSSLLSGLMTMASLLVSVTFVILTLAASQLGPRLIPTFMGDRQIQTVLGLFLGTILYVLVVLRSLDGTMGPEGVPHIAVTVGSAFTIVCMVALLFYVHKVARSIIVDNIVMQVARDLHRNIRAMLPENAGAAERSVPSPARPRAGTVSLERSGYIQVVDYDALVALARREQALLQVAVRAGHFILRNGEHVVVHAERPLAPETIKAIRSAFVVGEERTPAQDLEYSLRQLVEIALRALSAGINDPFTAIAVVDRLGAALEEIFERSLQPAVWCDKDGEARVIAQRSDAQGLTDAAFDAIRQAASGIPAVLIRMADVLGQLAPVLASVATRDAVERQLGRLAETAGEAHLAPSDRQAILTRIERARGAISADRKEGAIHVL